MASIRSNGSRGWLGRGVGRVGGAAIASAPLVGVALSLLLLGASGCAASSPPGASFSLPALATDAAYDRLSAPEIAEKIARGDGSDGARRALRAAGPRGLAAALEAYDAAARGGADASTLERLSNAADTAAQQRDAVRSRLYWHTDLEEAKRVAAAEHKPILSLRMLGHLDDELSCANSRFFRTTLYPDRMLGAKLRDGFVLHWSSERPVPIVTIDYGDGRVIKRTITGNSIHYVLDPDGHVIDAIPGLYSATEMAALLDAASAIALAPRASETEREEGVAAFHRDGVERERVQFTADATAVGFNGNPGPPTPLAMGPAPLPVPGAPPALLAIPAAASKAVVEMPIARAIAFELPDRALFDSVPWAKIGARKRSSVHVDDASRALMKRKAPLDWSTGKPAPLDDAGFDALVDKFEQHVAEDMVKNEYYFHAQIRRWIAADPGTSLAALNERVYRDLFLTPASDPWLGLVPPVVYSGIQGDGLAH